MEVVLWTTKQVHHHRRGAPEEQQVQPGLVHDAHRGLLALRLPRSLLLLTATAKS